MICILLTACAHSKIHNSKGYQKAPEVHEIIFIAWGEDTVLGYQFVFLGNSKFSYVIIKKKDSCEEKEFYSGSFKDSPDTFYLSYRNNLRPEGGTDYLIKEASGNYLIQYFTSQSRGMFLRIKHMWSR